MSRLLYVCDYQLIIEQVKYECLRVDLYQNIYSYFTVLPFGENLLLQEEMFVCGQFA